MIKKQLNSAAAGLIMFVCCLLLWVSVVPVVILMKATPAVVSKNFYIANVRGYKIRDCHFVKRSTVGWGYWNDEWREIPFQYHDDTSPDSSRPSEWSRQNFGLWRWVDQGKASDVRTTQQHDCGNGPFTTTIGPFKRPSF